MSTDVATDLNPSPLPADLWRDVRTVSAIPMVPTLLDVICRTTQMGFAAIARVTEDHWVACSVKDDILFGLQPGGELSVETTICHEIRQCGEAVVIDDVFGAPAYSNHPTPQMYGFQSYISVPITRKNGQFFGTLCAIDPHPHKIDTPEVRGMFMLFADLIAFHLEVVEALGSTEIKLKEERETAVLRDEFIAILGHDLRNPVGAIANGAQLLQQMNLDQDALRLTAIIKNSAFRMSELIENILDFARGRLGDGIGVKKRPIHAPDALLMQGINELRAVWPSREIVTRIDLPHSLYADGGRLAQLLSNLLGNALGHGSSDEPVEVDAAFKGELFELSVSNAGPAISKETMRRLFEPFSRGEVKPGQQGLGLGLYIAYKIAVAHDGDIEVDSNDKRTRFTFSMPWASPASNNI